MGGYIVTLKTGVGIDLKKIPREFIPSLIEKVESLAKEPLPHDSAKISGADNFYRVRSGDNCIIYQVLHQEKEVVVHFIRHRRIVYRQF